MPPKKSGAKPKKRKAQSLVDTVFNTNTTRDEAVKRLKQQQSEQKDVDNVTEGLARASTTTTTTTTSTSSSSSSSSSTKASSSSNATPDSATANCAPSFSTSSSAVLDLFFLLCRGIESGRLEELLEASWREDPDRTVRVLLHARDCRAGKGEKKAVYHALIWLRKNKPLTYLHNLLSFLSVGYFKDLLLLVEMLEEVGEDNNGGKLSSRDGEQAEYIELEILAEFLRNDEERFNEYQSNLAAFTQQPAASAANADQSSSSSASSSSTPSLPVSPARAPVCDLSLVSKWLPSENHSFDKKHKLAHRIAHLLFGNNANIDNKKTSVNALKQYRQLLSKLRSHLNLVESQMCKQQYDQINFASVPAKAHQLLKKAFQKRAKAQYDEYLAKLKKGEVSIKTAGLTPNDLCMQYITRKVTQVDETIEGAWRAIVADLKAAGALSSAVSVVDVSGSMSGTPMNVAVAMGLLIATVSTGAFHNRFITFHETPSWHQVEGSTLFDQVASALAAPWGGSTNLAAVFELILKIAVDNNVPQSAMPRTLFIFSDMQFNSAFGINSSTLPEDTNHQSMLKAYAAAGYTPPSIVYWNVNGAGCNDLPVTSDTPGVALVSGFSAELVKLFLSGDEITPLFTLMKAIQNYVAVIENSEV